MNKDVKKGIAFKKTAIGKYLISNSGILVGLVVIILFFTIATDKFFTDTNIINVLRQISVNAIVAFGMTYVILIGGIDLSVGSIMAVTGCLGVIMCVAGVPVIIAMLVAVILGIIIGFINGFVISKMKLPAFIATLAMMTIASGTAKLITGGKPTRFENEFFEAIGNGYLGPIPIPVIIMAIVFIIMAIILNKSKFGRFVYAVGGNRQAAEFSGIKITRVEIKVYTLSGLLAGLAGVITASRMSSGQPTAGEGQELDAIAAVVLGGTSFVGGEGHIGGTIIGALIIGILNNGLNLIQVSSYWQLVVKGVVIILAVYVDMIRKGREKKHV